MQLTRHERKLKAATYVNRYKYKYGAKELGHKLVEKYGYTYRTAMDLVYSSKPLEVKEDNEEKLSLKQQLDREDNKRQKAYEKRLEMAAKNRPKIIIDF